MGMNDNEFEFTIRHRKNKYKHYRITIFKDNESKAMITGPKGKSIDVDAYWEVNRLFKALTKYDPKVTMEEDNKLNNKKD